MEFSKAFSGKFWKASDLTKPQKLTITKFAEEAMQGNPNDRKWVAYFAEDKRGLVLNQTNANTIKSLYGDDSDDCVGKQVVLYKTTTEMQGRSVECVRLRGPKPGSPPMMDDAPF